MLKTFFNRVRLLIAAHLTSGEHLMIDGSAILGAAEDLGLAGVHEVEAVAESVAAEVKTVIGDVKADALKVIAALGAVHNTLGAFTLSDEIVAARTNVEQAIVSIATHFAKTLG